ncbi:MAG TPA: beta-ketoacyl-[acyl-carrier-protein] synthase family protein, partial [Polyangiaceae bacterium]
MSDRLDRIAVTGVGAISALGADARESFARLLRGERGLGEVMLFSTDGLRCRIAAQIPDSNLGLANSAQPPSRTDVLALCAARAALVDARLVPEPGTLGLVFGGTAGAMFETEQEIARFGPEERSGRRGARLVSHPLSRTVATLENELCRFSRAATLCSACSSGAAAIVQAAHWIRSGNSKAVLAGGADGLCRMTFAGFNALGALDPEPCRPFDRARKGLNLGEGAAFLLLESEASAIERGARILGFLSGWAIGAEAHHGTHPEPSGRRAAELMRSALECAGLDVADIDYVNAHGTATLHNDTMEAAALRLALGPDTARIAVSSTKGHLGHTLGAAGALEAVVTLLALDAGIAPATAGLATAEDEGLNHVMGDPRPGALRAAISNSFGFGGMDAVLVFEAANAAPRALAPRSAALVVTGSACFASGAEQDPRDALDPERSRRFDRLTARVTLGASAA